MTGRSFARFCPPHSPFRPDRRAGHPSVSSFFNTDDTREDYNASEPVNDRKRWLDQKGYDYWALAHVHQAVVLHERPHVVVCGNLQGRHIREIGAKGASLVTVEDGQIAEIVPLHVDCVRWTLL